MGLQEKAGKAIYNWGVNQRNKFVRSKDKTKRAKGAIKHAVKATGRAIQSYEGPDVDPFTGVNLKPWKTSRKKRRKR